MWEPEARVIEQSSFFLGIAASDVTSRFNQVFWFGDFNFRVEERHGVVMKFLEQCEDDDDPDYKV